MSEIDTVACFSLDNHCQAYYIPAHSVLLWFVILEVQIVFVE